MELTLEQRLAVIAKAVDDSKTITPPQSIEDFISDIKAEQIVVEHGLLDSQKEDVEDESQFLFTDSAEEVDEEDEDMGLSDEMKGVYK
jgi:predicted transcriptional regulator